MVSGTLGWIRKIKRRKEEGLDFYRSAKSTLAGRCRRKLLEKTTWYKTKRDDDEEEPKTSPNKRLRRDERSQHMNKYKNQAMAKNKNKEKGRQ